MIENARPDGLSRRRFVGATFSGFVVGAATGVGVDRLIVPPPPVTPPEIRIERVPVQTPEAQERREAYDHFLGIVRRFTNAEEMSQVPFPHPESVLPSWQFIYMNPGNGSQGHELTRALYLSPFGNSDPTRNLPTIKVVQDVGIAPNEPQWTVSIDAFIEFGGGKLASVGIHNQNNDVRKQGLTGYFPQSREQMNQLAKGYMKMPGFDSPEDWDDFPTPNEKKLYPDLRQPFGITKTVVHEGLQATMVMLETCEAKVKISPVSTLPRTDPHTPFRL